MIAAAVAVVSLLAITVVAMYQDSLHMAVYLIVMAILSPAALFSIFYLFLKMRQSFGER